MTELFEPLELRGTEFPNRVVVSPMCQHSCEGGDGVATEWTRVHLGSRAVGGAGLVMTEATAVEPRGRISWGDLGIWSDEHAQALSPITDFIKSQGSVPGVQLAHAGRKGSTERPWEGGGPLGPNKGGWAVRSPSGEAWPYDEEPPRTEKMDQAAIETVVDAFSAAAERADDAGFEVVEIHGAHGYLLHEFLSPVTNHRRDEYGGDFEGRTRLIREVAGAVREAWPDDKPLFVRLSATDCLDDENSWTVEQSIRLADLLASVGVDLIDVSGGGISPESFPEYTGPSYQLPWAERVREESESDFAVSTVGGITTPQEAQAIVGSDRADLVVVGREHLRDPYFTMHAAMALDATDEIEGPPQYRRAFGF